MELFRIAFLRVTLLDVLDILVISYILYKVYFFIRGTRAAQMTVGLVLILILSFLAPLFNMSALTWLFQNLKTVWLIAFVVVLWVVLTSLPVMLLWNWLMPMLFDLQTLSFWEAFGVTMLCALLFKSYNTSSKNKS